MNFMDSLIRLNQLIISRSPRFIPKPYLHFVFSNKGLLVLAMIVGNVLNFIFNAYLGRVLSFSELNLVVFVNTLWFVMTIVVGGFSSTTNHRVSYLLAHKGRNAMWAFFLHNLKSVTVLVLAISIFWIFLSPRLASFFHVEDVLVLILFTPTIIFGFLSYAFQGFLRGSLRFFSVAVVMLTEAISKLILAFGFFSLGFAHYVYLSIPLSLFCATAVGGLVIWHMRSKASRDEVVEQIKEKKVTAFPFKFFFSSMAVSVSTVVFLSFDILLVKHFFDASEAGRYALLSLTGKIIYFLGSLPMAFMVTLVSRRDGLKQSSQHVLPAIFFSVLVLVSLGFVALGVFGTLMAPLLFGAKALEVVKWLPLYTFSIALFTLGNVIVVYHLVKHHYVFSAVSLFTALFMVLGIWFNHDQFSDIVRIIFFASALSLGVFSLMHVFGTSFPFIERGLRDLWDIFLKRLPKTKPRLSTGKRILILNWRDITHMYAGGAEVYVHEIAKIWVASGNHVTLFCGNDGKQSRYENIDGINIVRRGGFYLVYVWAFLYYVLRFRGKYDIVVDCENGIPFFAPLYVGKPLFCLMHHVHQDVFFHSLPKPLAWLASTLEKDLMPLIYKKVQFITVSQSSKQEMEALGIGKAGISVVHPGIDAAEFTRTFTEKTPYPTVLYLGRLKAYKSVNVLIQAFRIVLSERPETRLIIAGDGDEKENLKRLVKELHISKEQIQFLGAVSHEKKIRLLQSSWVLVNPSFMEGWGIVVIEANACGTPVIASDVPGLRDSVLHNKAGYLVPYGDVAAFAKTILAVVENRELREKFETSAKEWAGNFTWEKTGKDFFTAISVKN